MKSFSQNQIQIQKKYAEPPTLTANCWSVYNGQSGEFLYGKLTNKQTQMASLTKIMTCYVVCRFMGKYGLQPASILVKVSKIASNQEGTTAYLDKGDQLTVLQLLYGMMLNSGNDAAMVLAESFGTLFYWEERQLLTQIRSVRFIDTLQYRVPAPESNSQGTTSCHQTPPPEERFRHDDKIKQFLREMNRQAQELGMTRTNYASVHGLSNAKNVSTARDIGLLCCVAMREPLFCQLVSCQQYKCVISRNLIL